MGAFIDSLQKDAGGSPIVRTVEEMINYLTEIKEEHGNLYLFGENQIITPGISTGKPLDENFKQISKDGIQGIPVLWIG